MTTDKINAHFTLRGPAAVTVAEAARIVMESDDFHSIEGQEFVTALRTIMMAGAKQIIRDSR